MPEAESAFHRLLLRLATTFVFVAGGLLSLLSLLVVVSVCGRLLFLRPVPGDFEIVALGTAIAAFLCLPYCQIRRGNVTVDLFLSRAPGRLRALLDAFAALLYALLSALFAWRMLLGLRDTLHYDDITMILGLPVAAVYPFAVLSFALLAVICTHSAWRLATGRGSAA